MVGRLGFACKYLHPDQTQKKKVLEEIQRPLTEKCTTITWLNRQTREVAEQRLWDIMEHNGAAAKRLIEYVGGLPNELRMVRLGSNQLPFIHRMTGVIFGVSLMSTKSRTTLFSSGSQLHVSLMFRVSGIRAVYCFGKSDNSDVVNRSIEEFEYPDINVHGLR